MTRPIFNPEHYMNSTLNVLHKLNITDKELFVEIIINTDPNINNEYCIELFENRKIYNKSPSSRNYFKRIESLGKWYADKK